MINSYPVVSVILPVYNAENYILQTLQSVQAQTYQKWELIVVDDNSTDRSWEIVKSQSLKDSRITVSRLNTNSGGPATPRNVGIDLSSGDLLAFIDSDDLWHPDKLSIQLEWFRREKMDFSCTELSLIGDENTIPEHDFSVENGDAFKVTLSALLRSNLIPLSTVLARKELFAEQRFSVCSKCIAVEDYDLWLRIHQTALSTYKLSLPLTYYRVRTGSLSASKFKMALRRYYVLRKFNAKPKFPVLQNLYYMTCYAKEALSRR